MKIKIVKKDKSLAEFDEEKIINAVNKSANRINTTLNETELKLIVQQVKNFIQKDYIELSINKIYVEELHKIVIKSLQKVAPDVAQSYLSYRNYKEEFVGILDKVFLKYKELSYLGDRDNANSDSSLIPTQRSLIFGVLSDELYKKTFLNKEELEAMNDGYIYIHDRNSRLFSVNCCLFDVGTILKDGFEMANMHYTEPNSLDVAFDVISDIVMSASACQYGGMTITEIDKILEPYARKSFDMYFKEYKDIVSDFCNSNSKRDKAWKYAREKVNRDFEQGFQSWEYKFNTLGSSRGDYPFVAVSFGLQNTMFGEMCIENILKVRKGGQGKKGFKKPVLFPKLNMFYDENLHGSDGRLEYLFDLAIECSSKCMYPDFISLTGEGYIPDIYRRYNKPISLMG